LAPSNKVLSVLKVLLDQQVIKALEATLVILAQNNKALLATLVLKDFKAHKVILVQLVLANKALLVLVLKETKV
jgi:hypothetical protein